MGQYCLKERVDRFSNFCSVKETVKRMRRQTTQQEKTFAEDTSEKGLLSKIHKELLKFNTKKMNSSIKKWAKHRNRHRTKEDIQMANKHVKRCSTSYVTREM